MVAAIVSIAAATALPACGGGGDGSDPLAGGPAVEDIRLQPGDRPLRFQLDDALPDEAKAFIVETLQWAHADLGDSGPLTVHVYSDEERFVTAYTAEFAISIEEARLELAGGPDRLRDARRAHLDLPRELRASARGGAPGDVVPRVLPHAAGLAGRGAVPE